MMGFMTPSIPLNSTIPSPEVCIKGLKKGVVDDTTTEVSVDQERSDGRFGWT